MIIEPILDDGKVRQMLVARGLWQRFLIGQRLSNAGNSYPKVWSLAHKEPGIIYLFYGFSGFEKESDNGYICQRVTYSPGEESQIVTMYQALLKKFGGQIRFTLV